VWDFIFFRNKRREVISFQTIPLLAVADPGSGLSVGFYFLSEQTARSYKLSNDTPAGGRRPRQRFECEILFSFGTNGEKL
jgi:hypothetical protein